MPKFNWIRVVAAYIAFIMGGVSCWVYVTWSVRDLWKGGAVGFGMLTLMLLSMYFNPLVTLLKKEYANTNWSAIATGYAFMAFVGMVHEVIKQGTMNTALLPGAILGFMIFTVQLVVYEIFRFFFR